MLSNISQKMPTKVRNLMRINDAQLYNQVTPSVYNLYNSLKLYLLDIAETKGKHGKSSILKPNEITLSPDLIYQMGVVVPAKYSEKRYANRNARKLTKGLVSAGILHPIEGKDNYLINPHYIYLGNKYGDVYKRWCDLTNTDYNPQFNALYAQYDEHFNNWHYVEDPDIVKKEWEQFNSLVDTTIYPSCELALPEPTSHFNDYLNLNPRDQFTSPYTRSYMSLADQYNRQALGNPYIAIDPDVPLSEAPDLSKPWTLSYDHPKYNPF